MTPGRADRDAVPFLRVLQELAGCGFVSVLMADGTEVSCGTTGETIMAREDDALGAGVVRAVLAYLRGEKGDLELAMELGKLRQKAAPNELMKPLTRYTTKSLSQAFIYDLDL